MWLFFYGHRNCVWCLGALFPTIHQPPPARSFRNTTSCLNYPAEKTNTVFPAWASDIWTFFCVCVCVWKCDSYHRVCQMFSCWWRWQSPSMIIRSHQGAFGCRCLQAVCVIVLVSTWALSRGATFMHANLQSRATDAPWKRKRNHSVM